MIDKLNHRYTYYFFAVLSVILFGYGLYLRPAHLDDAWIGEYSYWLNKLGFIKSELMRGINHQETYVVISHKLLVIIGAWFINLFGFSVFSLKAVSLLFLVSFIVFFVFVFSRNNDYFSRKQVVIFVALFISSALVQEFSFVFRPEIPLLFFGFISYYFLQRSIRFGKQWTILLAGVFAGIAVSTHLNGLVYCVAGFMTLLIMKRYLLLPGFVLSGLVGISVYFYDFTSTYGLELWQHQIFDSPFLDRDNGSFWFQFVKNVANEHMRFFHSPKEISLTLLTVFSLSLSFSHLKKRHLPLLIYTLTLMIVLAILAAHRTSKYALVYYPFVILLITYSIGFILDDKHPTRINFVLRNRILGILVLVYFMSQSVFNVLLSVKKEDLVLGNQQLAKTYLEGKKNVVADMLFMFNEIEDYRIQSAMVYQGLQLQDSSLVGLRFVDQLLHFETDVAMLNRSHIHQFKLEGYKEGDKIQRYLIVHKDEDLLVLEKQD